MHKPATRIGLAAATTVIVATATTAGVIIGDLRHDVAQLRTQVADQDQQLAADTGPDLSGYARTTQLDGLRADLNQLQRGLDLFSDDTIRHSGRLDRLEARPATQPGAADQAQLAALRADLQRVSGRVDYICRSLNDGPAGLGSFFC